MLDTTPLLESLNEQQRQAVAAPPGHLLVSAGPGSGKTRVLVHRIAWLLHVENIMPHSILAVTFTNKAAAEMRGRVEQLVGQHVSGMWLGTFHSLCHRLLRAHWQAAGLTENFQILDSEDQLRLIKRILKALDIDEERWPAKKAQWFINGKKDAGLRAQKLSAKDFYTQTLIRIYQAYETLCEQSSLVDFAELLLRGYELLKNNPELRDHYQRRFQAILVDEFQDTNTIQYEWLKLFVSATTSVMIVGDDDQSIYGWRGAKVENIQRFLDEFSDVTTIRLEQNYRSTDIILQAANAVIAQNNDRLGKTLWTEGNEGEPISLYAAFNEVDEARFIVERIRQAHVEGLAWQETAVLYRSNAQSRVLEEAFLQAQVPYRVYGGFRFFERAEIKDALAYLRLMNHRHDDAALERVINVPTRGIGEKTMSELRHYAQHAGISLWQAAQDLASADTLPARARQAVHAFIELIETADIDTRGLNLAEQVEHVLEHSGLLFHYSKERSEKARARVENLQELVSAAKYFEPEEQDDSLSPLAAFLTHAALEAGDAQADQYSDCVQLMTLHSAKGLEFSLVFIAGVEEGLLPHPMACEEPGRLEEERRLFYVGMTRAQQTLYLTYAELRRLYGSEDHHRPSRFIREIPKACLKEIRLKSHVSRPASFSYSADTQWKIGQHVQHPKFGDGIILNCEGNGGHMRLQVNFANAGVKWLVESHAKLTAVSA